MKGWFLFNYGILLDNLTSLVEKHADNVWSKKSVFNYAKRNNLLQPSPGYVPEQEGMLEYEIQVTNPGFESFTDTQKKAILLQSMLEVCVTEEYYEVAAVLEKEMSKIK